MKGKPSPIKLGPHPHGFTIVELLIVIGIIAVLIAILLPVLARAREMASRVQCTSNMRQIATASVAYAADNGGLFPEPLNWLYNWLTVVPTDQQQVTTGELWPYLKDLRPYHCPIDEPPWQGSHNLTSYLINGNILPANTGVLAGTQRLSRFKSNAVCFWEADETSATTQSPWNDGGSEPYEGITHRHGGGAAVGHFDGSAEFLSAIQWADELTQMPGPLWCEPGTANGVYKE